MILVKLPPEFVEDLPKEDQTAIGAIVGKPVLLAEYDDTGRAELQFTDSLGVMHSIWVTPKFIRQLK